MKGGNLDEIRKSFSLQAESFDRSGYHLSSADYLDYLVNMIMPQKTDRILEAAAGTCICGRALAPFCNSVVCLDATQEMLSIGRRECEKRKITNVAMVQGNAEELPFPDSSFDIVVTRLAFHHFADSERVFGETVRVLKRGGKLVLVDLVPQNNVLRREIDGIERMRDPSHTQELTAEEIRALYEKYSVKLTSQDRRIIEVDAEKWMELTRTPSSVRNEICSLFSSDISGGPETGFHPYLKDGRIFFRHYWVLFLGIKEEND